MWRFLAGAIAALALAGAGLFWFSSQAERTHPVLPQAAPDGPPATAETPLPQTVPEASPQTREERRFNRYDKNRDDRITRDEFLASRHKAFAKLDVNGDGRLSFDEWAVKSETKFSAADRNRDGALTRAEFATTAVKRKPRAPRCACTPAPDAEQPEN